jgi:hypothetical protein
MSDVPIIVHCHHGKESRCRELLAVQQLWRGMERCAAGHAAARDAAMAVRRAQVVRELRELIEALERRMPQIERAAEASIARDAAALKTKALNRIAELERDDHANREA